MKKLIQLLAFGALVAMLALPAFALGNNASFANASSLAQQGDDQVKADLYKKFTDNRKTNPQAAYDAAKEYLQKYPNDDDQIAQYLKKWAAAYEKEARKLKVPQLLYTDKNFAEAYSTGRQVLADEPDDLTTLIDLGYGGYLASLAKNDSFNADALTDAKRAIQLIESGKSPDSWAPFKGKDDTLAYLYYTVGFLNLKNSPNEAIPALIRAASFNSELKTTPSTYYFLAAAYEAGPYLKQSADYKAQFEGKPESDASKLALANLNQVIDRAIDAYARAVAASGNDPKNATNKAEWMTRLTSLYKFRHNNSDAGLNEFIASSIKRPLPPPPTPMTALPAESQPASTTPTSGTSGTATPSGSTPAQPAKPSSTPVQPANKVSPTKSTGTSKPASKVQTAKSKTPGHHARRP